MKLILLCISLLLAGISAKTPRTGRSNWPVVEINLGRLQELVYNTMLAIYTDANEDNPIVGERIGMKVNHAAESGIDLLAIVQREVVNKSLTVVIARQHIGELLVVFTDLYSSIELDLFELTDAARLKINDDFSNLFLRIPGIANEIYTALEEPEPLSCGIAGLHNNETIYPAFPLPSDLQPGSEFWRESIYSVHYIAILLHPHNKYIDSEITDDVENLWFAVTEDFPNFIEDTNMTSIHRVLLFHCADGSNVMYEFEFPIEDAIVEPTLSPVSMVGKDAKKTSF